LGKGKELPVPETGGGQFFVDPAHEMGIEEGGFALEREDPVRSQTAAADFIKPLFEKPLGRADGIGAVDEQDIDARLGRTLDPADRVLENEPHARILLGGGKLGEVTEGEVRHGAVDFDLDHFLDASMLHDFGERPPVPAAHDHDADRIRVGPKRRVNQHFVIDEMVAFGEHDAAVDDHEFSEVFRFIDLDLLKGAFHRIQFAPDPETNGAAGLGGGFHKPLGIIHHMGYLDCCGR